MTINTFTLLVRVVDEHKCTDMLYSPTPSTQPAYASANVQLSWNVIIQCNLNVSLQATVGYGEVNLAG